MNRKTIIQIVSVLFLAVLIVAVLFYKDFSSEYVSMFITFSIIMIAYSVYSGIRKKKIAVQHDELSQLTHLKSIKNSWLAVYFTVSVISLLHFFNIIFFTIEMLVFYLMISMNLSFFISLAVYKRRPESL